MTSGIPFRGCRPLTQDEIETLVQEIRETRTFHERDVALLLLQAKVGYRIKECLSLTIGDVWKFGKVVDMITVERKNMKGKKRSRTCPVPNSAKPNLEKYIAVLRTAGYASTDPLFPSQKKALVYDCPNDPDIHLKPISKEFLKDHPETKTKRIIAPLRSETVSNYFATIANRLEMQGKCNTHSLRKTFAANVYKATGHDIMQTGTALGHTNVGSTQAYLGFHLAENVMKVIRES